MKLHKRKLALKFSLAIPVSLLIAVLVAGSPLSVIVSNATLFVTGLSNTLSLSRGAQLQEMTVLVYSVFFVYKQNLILVWTCRVLCGILAGALTAFLPLRTEKGGEEGDI